MRKKSTLDVTHVKKRHNASITVQEAYSLSCTGYFL